MNTIEKKFEPLTQDELQAMAPSIFTDHAADRTSGVYRYTSTYDIVQDLIKFGWSPVRAIERRVKKSSNAGFQKHTVYFRNPNFIVYNDQKEIEGYPEICLINSHDGLNAFRFSLALFRVACSNGLVFQADDLGCNRIVHKGFNFEELESVIKRTVERIPDLIDRIESMKAYEMSEQDIHNFITQAVVIRERYSQGVVIRVDAKEVALPLREQDKANNLWVVYNRIQEKLLKGGIKNLDNNRKLKQVQYLDKILWINKDLWDLASGWLNSKPQESQPSFLDQVIEKVKQGKSVIALCGELNISKKKYYSLLSEDDKIVISQLRDSLK